MQWRRQWQPTPVLLPGKSHGQRSLVGCSPWGLEESDTTERLLFHFSLSCTGEGNGNPLQCSCLENPWDGGAWWAAISGVAQSRTRLKQLSSSSTPVFWPGEFHGLYSPRSGKESETTKLLSLLLYSDALTKSQLQCISVLKYVQYYLPNLSHNIIMWMK